MSLIVLVPGKSAQHQCRRLRRRLRSLIGKRVSYSEQHGLMRLASAMKIDLYKLLPGVVADAEKQIHFLELFSCKPTLVPPGFDSQQHQYHAHAGKAEEWQEAKQTKVPDEDQVMRPFSAERTVNCLPF